MNLVPVKKITFWVAVAIAALGVITYVLYFVERGNIPYLQSLAFFLVLVSFVLLCLRPNVKGY